MTTPNCYKCRYFKITWEYSWPYACEALNFKSKEIPWRTVIMASDLPCQMFSPKSPKKKKNSVYNRGT
ncbi:MAG: uracil-DNA glycosylase [Deltaproteobacteria bacterium]|nr:uracil-DNA glycosylase [Deltaproteobacteria bacterium]MBW2053377.1 uracil-DNA glycosylase [Deltaproteobacteria bacterium]MBW2142235.1 uracil-DNA glycosylase [Deltaproteobacteria bacterium]MBW2324825.1 uracil-DNA glycosylase [Deltaproteobacteria bacterium]